MLIALKYEIELPEFQATGPTARSMKPNLPANYNAETSQKIVGRDDATILDRTEAIRLKPELAREFAHYMSNASIPDDWETLVVNLKARFKKTSDDLTLRTHSLTYT